MDTNLFVPTAKSKLAFLSFANSETLFKEDGASSLTEKILATPYLRFQKTSTPHPWPKAASKPNASLRGCVNVAYGFVRRLIDSGEISLVLVSNCINGDLYEWGDSASPLLPRSDEYRALERLKQTALAQAEAVCETQPLQARLRKTSLYQSCPKEVQAFLEAALPLAGVFIGATRPTIVFNDDRRFTWENYLEFLHKLHRICKTMELRKTLYDRNVRMPHKRFDTLKSLLARLYGSHSRLLVIRVDLKYQEAYVKDVDFATHQLHVQDVCETAQRRKGIFQGCLGFALRMEDAPDTGLHCHVVFFFDGVKHCRDLHAAMRICNWWNDTVTLGKGLAWNVNQHWRQQVETGQVSPEDCVVGMVDRCDEDRVLKMVRVMRYLCHPGQDVLYKPNKTTRTFIAKDCADVP